MKNVMIDIETIGTSAGCGILSVAAVAFDDKTGETYEEFYERLDIKLQRVAGLKENKSTMDWWNKQSTEARDEAFSGQVRPLDFIINFTKFFKDNGLTGVSVWGNSAKFDLSILQFMFEHFGHKSPWNTWKELCLKTVCSLRPGIKSSFSLEFEGVAHNPVDDCKHQVKYLVATLKELA